MKRVIVGSVFLCLVFIVLLTLRSNVVDPPSTFGVEDKRAPSLKERTPSADPNSSSELKARIDQLIGERGLDSARWGISVISLADGTTLYNRDADRLFTPASNMKIYTTAVALDFLGAEYRWRTSVYSAVQPDGNGSIQGDLVLYGRGAPDLLSRSGKSEEPSLTKLADDLYARGVRSIRGNVVGDESYFRGNALGDGWQWNDVQWYFGAEPSALSIDGNEIELNVVPGVADAPTIRTSDSGKYVTVQNRMTLAKPSSRGTIGIQRGLSDNDIAVWGEFPPGSKGFGARLSVHNPALWAANLFRDALKTRGISIEGKAVAKNANVAPGQRFDPTKAVELAFVTSQPLSEIVRITNKESNNLFAELILRTLGRERGAMVELPEPSGRERGDDESGVALVRLWLARAGITTDGLAIHDGSGLSRLNLVTPNSTARLLIAISKTSSGEAFKQSLPIAGKDGTLAGRLKNVGERVVGKTGSLTYDNSLSGYLTTSDGRTLAFSILCNDQTGHGSGIKFIDEITSLIASLPHLPDRNSEKPNK
ncbi:MAG TPA: D-alanyl-D-alanine carboxypeptidase/D-alanyl-D-alanine-endopeptidase [Pyrinomonadaceae bacterium]|nr:D-alanyl-D-alanine carboxypeptidase/D-alanyl-D-alanine-endopeptidase [Pyrinomonadaceae bacterium]